MKVENDMYPEILKNYLYVPVKSHKLLNGKSVLIACTNESSSTILQAMTKVMGAKIVVRTNDIYLAAPKIKNDAFDLIIIEGNDDIFPLSLAKVTRLTHGAINEKTPFMFVCHQKHKGFYGSYESNRRFLENTVIDDASLSMGRFMSALRSLSNGRFPKKTSASTSVFKFRKGKKEKLSKG